MLAQLWKIVVVECFKTTCKVRIASAPLCVVIVAAELHEQQREALKKLGNRSFQK